MRVICEISDLAEYGLIPLSGEECALRYRILFDVTDAGRNVLASCFNLKDLMLEGPRLTGSPASPHLGAIMLAPEMLQAVGIFCLFQAGCTEVWKKGDRLFGIESSDDPRDLENFKKEYGPLRRFVHDV